MDFPFDQCLFHYTTREAALGHILPFGKLRMPSLERMRDPLENKTWFFGGGAWAAPTSSEKPLKNPVLELLDFNLLANSIRDRARLLAFTRDAAGYSPLAREFSRGWARPRMWENYGENHRGVCLVFDRDELIERIRSSLQRQGLPQPYYKPVEYTETGGAELTLDLTRGDREVNPEFVSGYIEEHHVELFFRKALDWATEYEYRFLVTVPDGWDDVLVDWTGALRGVIAGEKFPGWQRPAAHVACERAAVPAMRLDWTMGRPVLADLPREGTMREDLDRLLAAMDELPAPPTKPPPADTPSDP